VLISEGTHKRGIPLSRWPTDTILRGQAVFRDREVVEGTRGEYLHRSTQLVGRSAGRGYRCAR
jgi:hypothetical protein